MKKTCDFCDNELEVEVAVNSVGGNQIMAFLVDIKCKKCNQINTIRKVNPELVKEGNKKNYSSVMKDSNMFG